MSSLGLDIGGSHVTASVIEASATGKQPLHLLRKSINSFDTAFNIIEAISDCIREVLSSGISVAEVGIAFPGPFDYQKGVSTVRNVGGKFEQTFGIHLRQALKDATGLRDTLLRFSNDAHCFAAGAYARAGLSSKRSVFLTLGTGFGSAFMENGQLLTHHPTLPPIGAFYNEPFLDSIADDYFSTRWFHDTYTQATGGDVAGVRELARLDNELSKHIFNEFGANLGSFLLPWLEKFECDELVIGGNISRANALFLPSLKEKLAPLRSNLNIIFCEDTEECILTGAAYLAKQENSSNIVEIDNENHFVKYDTIALAEQLCDEKTAIVDGDGVGAWETLREQLHLALDKKGKRVFWYDINACLQSGMEDNAVPMAVPSNLSAFFDEQKISMLRPDEGVDLCIVYGSGASLSKWEGKLINLDLVEKPILQERLG
jgi:predicted NBD/HSP70 family sugar kinase